MSIREKIQIVMNFRGKEINVSHKRLLLTAYGMLIAVSAVMTLINGLEGAVAMTISSLVLCGGFILCFGLMAFFNKANLSITLFSVIINVVFTYYFFVGGSEGYSCLWLLVFPYATMTLVGLWYGLVSNIYIWLMLVLFCWTPLRGYLLYDYSKVFLTRLPILFTFSMVVALGTSYSLQKARLEREQVIAGLNDAVAAERKKNMDQAMQSIISIGYAVDAKDQYTNEHSLRVAKYAQMIAAELGWSEEEQHNICVASMVHDIGKIGVPDAILKKPGRLTDEEFAVIKKHPKVGYDILKDYDAVHGAADGILYHHERYDGSGYPMHLKGDEIPVYGRIIAVADAFDAMNSNRVYRKANGQEYIVGQLQQGRGSQFDPQFADIMLRLIAEGKISFHDIDEEDEN